MPQATATPAPRAQAIEAPQTRAELDALAMTRAELRDQRSAATQRRAELMTDLRMASEADRPVIQARIATLDARTAVLEQRIQAADDAIAAAMARGLASQPGAPAPEATVVTLEPPMPPVGYALRDVMLINGASVLLLAALFWTIVRRRLRAGTAPAIADTRRLDQLQQAVDTMAVEVERISEGQRFVTKLLNERLQPAVGAGESQRADPSLRPG